MSRVPPGLILTADGNTFSGPSFSRVAPKVSSPTPFSVIATVTSGPVSLAAAPFSLTVAPVLALAGGPAADLDFTVGSSVVPTPAVTAGTTAIGALSLALVANGPVALPAVCPGLVFDLVTGIISGTPTATCALNGLQIQATDIDGATAVTALAFALNVAAPVATPSGSLLASAIQGNPYSSGPLVVTGGRPPYTWSLASGTLPAGLTLAPAGTLAGTPSVAGTFSFAVKATDAVGVSSLASVNQIIVVDPTLVVAGTTTATGAVGEAITFTPTVTGGSGSYASFAVANSSGTLAALGLSFNPTSGAITGTALSTAAGSWSGTLIVTDSHGHTGTSALLSISINSALSVVASATTATGAVGEAFTPITVTAAGGAGTKTFAEIDTSGTLAALGLSLSPSSGTISAGTLVAGSWTGKVKVSDPGNPTGTQTASISISINAGLTIAASTTTATGAVGEAFTPITVTPSGGSGALTYSAVATSGSLSGIGVSINPATGTISPTTDAAHLVAGTWTGTIKVTDPANPTGAQTASIGITINATLSVSAGATSRTAFVGEVFAPITMTSAGGNGNKTFAEVDTSGTLAALGLSLSNSTGAISGTPTATGTWSGTVKVTDPGNSTGAQTAAITITVNAGLAISGSPGPGTVGTAYSFTPTVTGGSGGNGFSVTNTTGTLAAIGLSFNTSTGAITGAAGSLLAGTWTGSIVVTDAGGESKSIAASITVSTPLAFKAFAWGLNSEGEIGDNTVSTRLSPVSVSGGKIYTKISTGFDHTCGIVNDGTLQCWGNNNLGQAGLGNAVSFVKIPTTVAGVTNVTDVFASHSQTCFISNGTPFCMGNGFPKTPAAVAGWSGTAIAVASQGLNGGAQSCAVLNTGSVTCWPQQSNNGSLTTIAGITTAVKIAIGGSQGTYCVITTTGALRCWGDNTFGNIGDGSNGSRVSIAAFTVFASGVTDVAMGEISTCAVVNGGAQCWGANASGEIGSGSATGTKSPTAVLNMTSGVTKISLTVAHTCAIQNGNAFCWGDGTSGDLGNGGTSQQNAPVAVINAPGVLTSISTGDQTSVGF